MRLRSFPPTWLAPEVLPQLGARISALLGKPLWLGWPDVWSTARFGRLAGEPKLLEDSTLGLVATVGFEERPCQRVTLSTFFLSQVRFHETF